MATETLSPTNVSTGAISAPVLLSPAQQVLLKLNDLFEPAESLRWLAATQQDFDASPMQLIEQGRADIVLHMLIRLDEGIHI